MSLKLDQNIFFYDALGAGLTAVLVVFLVGNNSGFFGLEPKICKILGLIALGFCVYSLLNHFISRSFVFRLRLGCIAMANLFYCVFTFLIVFGILKFDSSIPVTIWGKMYFLGEIALVLMLISIEFRILKGAKNMV